MKTICLALAAAGFLAAGYAPALAAGSAAEDIEKLEALVGRDRENVRALNDLGRLHLEAGRLDEAERRFREALAVPPAYTLGPFLFGDIYSDAERYQAAIDDYREIIAQNGEYARARNHLGQVFLARNQAAAARREFEEALKINPEYAEARVNLRLALGSPPPEAPDPREEASLKIPKNTADTDGLACAARSYPGPARCGLRKLSPFPSGEPARAHPAGEEAGLRFLVRQASREETPVQAAPANAAAVEFAAQPAPPAADTPPAETSGGAIADEAPQLSAQEPRQEAPHVKVLKVGAGERASGESSGPAPALPAPENQGPETAAQAEEALWDENTQEPHPMSEWLFQYPK